MRIPQERTEVLADGSQARVPESQSEVCPYTRPQFEMSFKPFFSGGKRSFCRRHSSTTRKCCWVSGVRTRRLQEQMEMQKVWSVASAHQSSRICWFPPPGKGTLRIALTGPAVLS